MSGIVYQQVEGVDGPEGRAAGGGGGTSFNGLVRDQQNAATTTTVDIPVTPGASRLYCCYFFLRDTDGSGRAPEITQISINGNIVNVASGFRVQTLNTVGVGFQRGEMWVIPESALAIVPNPWDVVTIIATNDLGVAGDQAVLIAFQVNAVSVATSLSLGTVTAAWPQPSVPSTDILVLVWGNASNLDLSITDPNSFVILANSIFTVNTSTGASLLYSGATLAEGETTSGTANTFMGHFLIRAT